MCEGESESMTTQCGDDADVDARKRERGKEIKCTVKGGRKGDRVTSLHPTFSSVCVCVRVYVQAMPLHTKLLLHMAA